MKMLAKIALLSTFALISFNSYAVDCQDEPDHVHCLSSKDPVGPPKWHLMVLDGKTFGPYCLPINSFESVLSQEDGPKYEGQSINWTIEQCENEACKKPVTLMSDTFTVIKDPQKPTEYTSTPTKDSHYQGLAYGDNCSQATSLNVNFKTK